MNSIVPTWPSTAVALGGAVLVVLASLERILGRPIPRLKYSRPVPRQRTFFLVPIFMIVAWIGALVVLLPMRICSDCPAPYPYQQFGLVIASLVIATGAAGGLGFLVFLIVWIGSVAYHASASVRSHHANSR